MSLLRRGAIISGSIFIVGIIAMLTLGDRLGLSPDGATRLTKFLGYVCLAIFGFFWMAHTWRKKG
jgi:hypothetical protein